MSIERSPLHVVVGGRKTGKTQRMLELLRGTPSGLIVVSTRQQARLLADLGYGSRLVTKEDIRHGALQGRNPRLLIDNAESLIQSLVGPYEITALSFTGEGEILRRDERTDTHAE